MGTCRQARALKEVNPTHGLCRLFSPVESEASMKLRLFLAAVLLVVLGVYPAFLQLCFGQDTQPDEKQPATQPDEQNPSTRPATQPAEEEVADTQPDNIPDKPKRAKKIPKTLDECRQFYMKGEYATAARGYQRLVSAEETRISASIGLAESKAIEGKYEEALKAMEAVADSAAADYKWQVAMAELLSTMGRYDDALKHAVRATELKPEYAPAVYICGSLLELLGREQEAVAVYKKMEDIVLGEDWKNDSRSLVALGKILDRYSILTGRKASEQAANILHNYLQEAYQRVDPGDWSANIAAGEFLLSKHRPEQAAKEFELALSKNRRLPDAFVGIAVLQLEGWQFEACLQTADEALKINPNHCNAHLVKAACMMQWRKFDEASANIDNALKANPNQIDALCMAAALQIRLLEPENAKSYIERVEKINPRCWQLYNTIADVLSAGRQFDEAEKYYKTAIEYAPTAAEPVTGLGLLYMQTGDEDKARETLTKANEIDDFRADVVNYLTVLRELEKFQVLETEHFIVKVDGKYDAVLLKQASDYAESIYDEVCGDFNYYPEKKTIIEFFPTHPGFSMRISGRGWIGTVGACTGRVIVLAAPTIEKSRIGFGLYNWPSVIRHEFTHTITLTGTKNRIPHWFTEACAVWQQPDRRNYDAVRMLVAATRAGQLMPVRELDWGFIRPKRQGDRSLAYAEAEWIMEYIIATYKYPKVIEMLEAFRDGMTQSEVFTRLLGVDEQKFDENFFAWAKEEVRSWGFNPDPPPDIGQSQAAVNASPENAEAQATLALAFLSHGNAAAAEQPARKALDLDPNNTMAIGVLATVLAGKKEYDEAIDLADRLSELDAQSKVAPQVLANCYLAKRSWVNAIKALKMLKQRQPLDPWSYEQLAKIYVQLGKPEEALPNHIELHRRTMNQPQYARQAAEAFRAIGRNDQAVEYFHMVTDINPYDITAYKAMAEIYMSERKYENAIDAATDMCLVDPKSAEAWTYKAIAYYRFGKAEKNMELLAQARQASEKALELDPECRAGQVLEMIKAVEDELKPAGDAGDSTNERSQ